MGYMPRENCQNWEAISRAATIVSAHIPGTGRKAVTFRAHPTRGRETGDWEVGLESGPTG